MRGPGTSIGRPIGASLLALALILAGLLALHRLGVTALPAVSVPRVLVSVHQSGASPDVLAGSVITPLERHLGRISGLDSMYSSSKAGEGFVQLSFAHDVDMNRALRQVEQAVSEASSDLPAGLDEPSVQKISADSIPTVELIMTSKLQPSGELINTASTRVAPLITAIPGVSGVKVFGVEPDAVVIDVDLARLAALGLTSNDVANIISAASHPSALGTLDDGDTRSIITETSPWMTVSDIAGLVLLARNGVSVRLDQVAHVWRAPRDESNLSLYDGAPAVVLQVFKLPGANALEIDREITLKLDELTSALPPEARLFKSFSAAPATATAVRDAAATLMLSCLLVAVASLFFLKNTRAAIAATLAIPLALAGTLIAILGFGYTLNLLTLLALTISVGFIVDDAVIVTESISYFVESGIPPRIAAALAVRELRFTVLSITFSLVCAFIPLLIGSDASLQMFRPLSTTLVWCVILSAGIALVFIPAFCVSDTWTLNRAQLPTLSGTQASDKTKPTAPMLPVAGRYARLLDFILQHRRVFGWMPVVLVATTFALYRAVVANAGVGFMPVEDTRLVQVSIDFDPGISASVLARRLAAVDAAIRQDPSVSHAAAMAGTWGATMNVELRRGPDRGSMVETPMGGVVRRLSLAVRNIPGVAVGIFPVNYLGTSEGANKDFPGRVSTFELVSRDGTALRPWVFSLAKELERQFGKGSVSTEFDRATVEQRLVIDRDKASRLGVPMGDIDAALSRAYSETVVGDFLDQNQFRSIVLRAEPSQRASPASLLEVHVRTRTGEMIPLSAIATLRGVVSPVEITHQNQLETTSIGFREVPKVAGADFANLVRSALYNINAPKGIVARFSDEVTIADTVPDNTLFLVLFALACIYVVLGLLYEDLMHPLTILSSIPAATAGAMLAMYIADVQFTLMSELSLVLVIAIVKKNAILIVDAALQFERMGSPPPDAIKAACLRRVRPIVMTTFTSLAAAIPLAIGFGRGADVTRPLGIALVGGIIASQFLSLVTTPAAYLWKHDMRVAVGRALRFLKARRRVPAKPR